MIEILKNIARSSYYSFYGKSGKNIRINNEDYVASAFIARGISPVIDETPLKLLINLSKNAEVVFDIGANVGVIAMMVSRKMQTGTVIYSFEPAPLSYKYLADTARVQKGNARIKPQNVALSNANGKLYFTNDGHSCTNHVADEKDEGVIAIDAITLDWFCQTNTIVPQVIKVDVEGAEYWALEGMQQTLKNNDVAVLIEIHRDFLAANKIDNSMFARLIDDIGYKVFNTEGEQIGSDQVLNNSCIIIAKDKPAAHVFRV